MTGTPWRTLRLIRHPLFRDDRVDPVGYCDCEDPVVEPVGGWFPSSFVVCHICQRPPRPETHR